MGMTTGPQKITLAEMRLRRAWPADLLQRLPLLPLDGDQRRFAPRARPPCSTSATTAPTEWPGSPRCVHWNNGGRPIPATCGSQKVGLTIRILPAPSPPPVIDVTSQRAQSPPTHEVESVDGIGCVGMDPGCVKWLHIALDVRA